MIRLKDVSSDPEDFNIYCTAADSVLYSAVSLDESSLLRQIKLCSLLGEHVFISCDHVYENPHTRNLLTNNPDLLRSGIVAIGLRRDCRDFADLLELRGTGGREARAEDVALTGFLDRETSTVIRWTPIDLQPHFKASIAEVLQNPDSLLRRRLTGVRKVNLQELCRRISDLPDEAVTRKVLHDLAAEHVPNRRRAFMREMNLLYYTIGAAHTNLRPHLSPALFGNLQEGHTASIRGAPLDEWLEGALREAEFPTYLLDCLSVERIAQIREESVGTLRRFRRKWWSLVSSSGSEEATGDARRAIEDRLREGIASERRRLVALEKTCQVLSFVSLIFPTVIYQTHPAMVALPVLLSGGAFAASQPKVKYRTVGAHFAALTSDLVKRGRASSVG